VAYFVSGLSDDPPRGTSAYRAAEEAALKRSLQLLGEVAPCSMRRNRTKDTSKVRCKYAGSSSHRARRPT
jgi:hypothetical protein